MLRVDARVFLPGAAGKNRARRLNSAVGWSYNGVGRNQGPCSLSEHESNFLSHQLTEYQQSKARSRESVDVLLSG